MAFSVVTTAVGTVRTGGLDSCDVNGFGGVCGFGVEIITAGDITERGESGLTLMRSFGVHWTEEERAL